MNGASIESSFQILSLLCCLIAVARLLYLKLARKYPFFFTFLCIPLILQIVVVVYGTRSRNYFYAWWVLEPLRNISYILVVWELFSAVFRNYAGLRSLSRWVMGLAAIFAPVGLILTYAAASSVAVPKFKTFYLMRFERGVTFGLVIFIVILLYFISRYPIKLPRNIVVLCMLYTIWFLADSALLLAVSFVTREYVGIVNVGFAVFESASYIVWAVMLTKAGEFQETRVRHNISREREEALIGELDAMNAALLRAGRSISQSRATGD